MGVGVEHMVCRRERLRADRRDRRRGNSRIPGPRSTNEPSSVCGGEHTEGPENSLSVLPRMRAAAEVARNKL